MDKYWYKREFTKRGKEYKKEYRGPQKHKIMGSSGAHAGPFCKSDFALQIPLSDSPN